MYRSVRREPLVLSGKDLTLDSVVETARHRRKVAISGEAAVSLKLGRQLVLELMDEGVPVYGGNTGVGWNKDIGITSGFVAEFNRNLLNSHSVGISPYADADETRAALLIRLNTLLTGHSGISPEIPVMLAEFLNRGILPMIPERGSVGQSDIGCLAHIGRALIGEGNVLYNGVKVPAREALEAENLSPVPLGPKDGLAIASSNALSSSQAAVAIYDTKKLLRASEIVYCLSLEGFNGNISPLDGKAHAARGFEASARCASRMSGYIDGSYINKPSPRRALQDPLCFRNGAHLYGAASDVLQNAERMLTVAFNHSDDNPCLIQEERRIVSCSNFDPLPWVLELETVAIVLSHVSKASCLRSIKLASPSFTGLSRNLAPDGSAIAFSTLQKTFSSLDAEIRLLANPVSMDTFSLAGDMEDISTNAPLAAQKLRRITDDLRYIIAIELMLACQAIDLRGDVTLGRGTAAAYKALRGVVAFYAADDHALTDDIYKVYELLRDGTIIEGVNEDLSGAGGR